MSIETTKLTIRLPVQDVAFVKQYAKDHGVTVTEVIDRYLRRMRELESHTPSPALEAITGIIPDDIDARTEYREHQLRKHRS